MTDQHTPLGPTTLTGEELAALDTLVGRAPYPPKCCRSGDLNPRSKPGGAGPQAHVWRTRYEEPHNVASL